MHVALTCLDYFQRSKLDSPSITLVTVHAAENFILSSQPSTSQAYLAEL
jgi:hypothetical protein